MGRFAFLLNTLIDWRASNPSITTSLILPLPGWVLDYSFSPTISWNLRAISTLPSYVGDSEHIHPLPHLLSSTLVILSIRSSNKRGSAASNNNISCRAKTLTGQRWRNPNRSSSTMGSSSYRMALNNTRPYTFTFPPATTALIIIDMQRDFVDPNGFGSIQCGNPEIFSAVRSIVPTIQKVLHVSRAIGLQVIHTREGHRPDLSDLPASKKLRQVSAPMGHHTMGIGDQGPMGRLLVRGEWGHDIIDELKPLPDEVVIDKPGKGSYWGTGLHRALLARGITHLLFSGVTTE